MSIRLYYSLLHGVPARGNDFNMSLQADGTVIARMISSYSNGRSRAYFRSRSAGKGGGFLLGVPVPFVAHAHSFNSYVRAKDACIYVKKYNRACSRAGKAISIFALLLNPADARLFDVSGAAAQMPQFHAGRHLTGCSQNAEGRGKKTPRAPPLKSVCVQHTKEREEKKKKSKV